MFTFDVHQYGGQLKGGHVTENDLLNRLDSENKAIFTVFCPTFCVISEVVAHER